MSKLKKGIEMIKLLQANGKMNINDLAKKLNMKHRNVRKYKEELVDIGVKIRSQSGKKGGYILEEKVFTEKFMNELGRRMKNN